MIEKGFFAFFEKNIYAHQAKLLALRVLLYANPPAHREPEIKVLLKKMIADLRQKKEDRGEKNMLGISINLLSFYMFSGGFCLECTLKVRILQFSTTFTQVYTRPKKIYWAVVWPLP